MKKCVTLEADGATRKRLAQENMDRGCDKDMDDLHIKMSDALDSCKRRRIIGETCLGGSVG